jgi:hypothetical protein
MNPPNETDSPASKADTEDLMERIRKEAQEAFVKETKSNNRISIILIMLAILAIIVWALLFTYSESPKLTLLWGLFLIGEGLGIGLIGVAYMIDYARIALQREHLRIELQMIDLHERFKGIEETLGK